MKSDLQSTIEGVSDPSVVAHEIIFGNIEAEELILNASSWVNPDILINCPPINGILLI